MSYGLALFLYVSATALAGCVLPKSSRPFVLLWFSYGCLALWRPLGLGVLLVVTGIAYVSGRVASAHKSTAVAGLCVAATVAPLGALKFVAPLQAELGSLSTQVGGAGTLAQFGLSFFTLQAVGYILDVRSSRIQAQRGFSLLALYLAFFPKLLAGPIERAGAFFLQLRQIRLPQVPEIIASSKSILLGLFAKFVVANALAEIGGELSAAKMTGGGVVALSCMLYSYQIYFDFFGYSVIAIGVARLLGIALSENFHTPYAARSLKEFWQRWHMTLSFWFRDFVYKPLGGNRGSESRRWAVVFLVFVCSGLWHGAAWNFFVWGGLHAGLYLVGTATLLIRRRVWAALGLLGSPAVHRSFQSSFVFLIVTVAWVFFRSPDLRKALDLLGHGFGLVGSVDYLSLGAASRQSVLFAIGLLVTVAVFDIARPYEKFCLREPSGIWPRVGQFVALDVMLIGLLLLGSGEEQAFIYFRF